MRDDDLPMELQLQRLGQLARQSLDLWDLPRDAQTRLINVSENTTYMVEHSGAPLAVMRIHRTGYHSRHAIACELAWMEAIRRQTSVVTPKIIPGRDGQAIQYGHADGLSEGRFIVLFQYIEGEAPEADQDLTPGFETLGGLAAACHDHALSWERPADFERLTWDAEAVFGPAATWGNWRDAPGVTEQIANVLTRVETTVRRRLAAYGKSPERFNLIHADMRMANLLIGSKGTRLIDFDDCGFGWLMYDFAAAISFVEDDPRIPDLKAAWLRGYRRVRSLDASDEAEIETMIMLRRMALLAWIGSHIEAPEPQALAPDFAERTARLGRAFLERQAG